MQTVAQKVVKLFEQRAISKGAAYELLTEVEKAHGARESSGGPQPGTTNSVVESLVTLAPQAMPEVTQAQQQALVFAAFGLLAYVVSGESEVWLRVASNGRVRDYHLDFVGARTLSDLLRVGEGDGEEPVVGISRAFVARLDQSDCESSLDSEELRLEVRCVEAKQVLRLVSQPERFEPGVLRQLSVQLTHFLQLAREQGDVPLAELDLLPETHRQAFLDYNRTEAYAPLHVPLHELFYAQARQRPDATAVSAVGKHLTYGQVNRDSNQLAHLLVEIGVKRGELIGVVSHRTVHAPVAFLGVLKAGCTYVPMEPTYPAARVAEIARISHARVLVVDRRTLERSALDWSALPGIEYLICLDGEVNYRPRDVQCFGNPSLRRRPAKDLPLRSGPKDIAYVIFTSGSTGTPKGVVIRHDSVVNTVVGVNNLVHLVPEDRVLCFSSFSFDLSVWDIFGSWAVGAEVVIASERQIRSPSALMDLMSERSITIWNSTPAGMQQLTMQLQSEPQRDRLDALRLVMLSGEFIPLTLPAAIACYFPNARVLSLGGATEGTVWSIYYPVGEVDPRWKSIPYGRPLPNQTYYVLNENHHPCAIGQAGMLYIGGKGVARGYLGDPERTESAFQRDPFSREPDGLLYCTGDLGRMRYDGQLEILGRADDQVKVRGFRIELGEVESHLSRVDGVAHAAVVACEASVGGKRLVGFVVPSSKELSLETLRKCLSDRLPNYMIPSEFVFLESLPVNASGKVDRRKLLRSPRLGSGTAGGIEERVTEDNGRHSSGVAPKVESLVSKLVCDLLGLDEVSRDDSFFLIGGDSLLSLQYVSRLKSAGYDVGPADVLQHDTVAKMAAFLVESGCSQRKALRELHLPGPVFLGPMQRRFFEVLELDDPDHWNQSVELRLTAPLDLEALYEALEDLCQQHPMLRAQFSRTAGRVYQEVRARTPLSVETKEITALTPWGSRSQLSEIRKSLHKDCRIEGGPLMKVAHVRVSKRDVRLIWVLHHLICDAYSWRVLVEDLGHFYRAATKGEPRRPLPRSDAYRAYVDALDAHVTNLQHEERGYWQGYLERSRFDLLLDGPDGPNLEGELRSVEMTLTRRQTEAIQRTLSDRYSATVFEGLLTCFLRTLARTHKRSDVTIDLVSHGRGTGEGGLDLSRTVGWCAQIHPFTLDLPTSCSLSEHLEALRAEWKRSQQYNSAFGAIRHSTQSDDLQRSFEGYTDQDVLFNYLGSFDSLLLPEDWQILGSTGMDRGETNARSHHLEVESLVVDGRLHVRMYYAVSTLSRARVRRWLRGLRAELVAVAGTGEES